MDFKLSVFRFNAKKDYLPYYKKYNLNLDANLSLKDLLVEIKKQDEFFGFSKDHLPCVVVNSYFVDTDIKLSDIVSFFGEELTIEPVSKKRAMHDLDIDLSDFKQSIKKLEDIVGKELHDESKTYVKYFYASKYLNYDSDFLGTSTFLLACKLAKKHPDKKDSLLSFVGDEDHGIWYHSKLKIFPEDNLVEDCICDLKYEILEEFPELNKNTRYFSKKQGSLDE